MPNWVCNKVLFSGDTEKINEMKEFIKGEDTPIDFNKLIPIPDDLQIDAGSSESFAIHAASLRKEGKTGFGAETLRPYQERKTFDEWADLGEKYMSNIDKYGVSTWYDWCIEHWGTKWNACDAAWINDECLMFETAWTTPEPIFGKLAELFPDVSFYVSYANEDLNQDSGIIEYSEGCLTHEYVDSYEFACDVWGYEPEDEEDEFDSALPFS